VQPYPFTAIIGENGFASGLLCLMGPGVLCFVSCFATGVTR